MRFSGTVLYLEFGNEGKSPFLVLDGSAGMTKCGVSDREILKVVRRSIATGDNIECLCTLKDHEDWTLKSFTMIKESVPDAGHIRMLRITHAGPNFGLLAEDYKEPAEIAEEYWDQIENGEVILRLEWEGYSAGVDFVFLVGGTYFYSSDSGIFGPFDSLTAALQWSECDTINSSFQSISCSELSSKELSQLLSANTSEVDTGFKVTINDEVWQTNDRGRLVRHR